MTRYMCIQTTK